MELGDMHGSGPCARKSLWVRLPPSAQESTKLKTKNIKQN